MSLLSRFFGGKDSPPRSEPVVYKGFTIVPEPISEGSHYRIAAMIEKTAGGEERTHRMIRADVLEDPDIATEISTAKAKQMIDEQGERLFGWSLDTALTRPSGGACESGAHQILIRGRE